MVGPYLDSWRDDVAALRYYFFGTRAVAVLPGPVCWWKGFVGLASVDHRLTATFTTINMSNLILINYGGSSTPRTAGRPIARNSATRATTDSVSPSRAGVIVNAARNSFTSVMHGRIGNSLRTRNCRIRLVPFASCMHPGLTLTRNSLSVGVFRRGPCLSAFGGRGGLSLIRMFRMPATPLNVCSNGGADLSSMCGNVDISTPGSPDGFTHTLIVVDSLN